MVSLLKRVIENMGGIDAIPEVLQADLQVGDRLLKEYASAGEPDLSAMIPEEEAEGFRTVTSLLLAAILVGGAKCSGDTAIEVSRVVWFLIKVAAWLAARGVARDGREST